MDGEGVLEITRLQVCSNVVFLHEWGASNRKYTRMTRGVIYTTLKLWKFTVTYFLAQNFENYILKSRHLVNKIYLVNISHYTLPSSYLVVKAAKREIGTVQKLFKNCLKIDKNYSKKLGLKKNWDWKVRDWKIKGLKRPGLKRPGTETSGTERSRDWNVRDWNVRDWNVRDWNVQGLKGPNASFSTNTAAERRPHTVLVSHQTNTSTPLAKWV